MKILLVSMNSIHFTRWASQLEDSGHEVYWFDIRDGGYSGKLSWVKQFNGWKQKYPNLKGRYFIKNKLPCLYKTFSFLIENRTDKSFEKVLKEVKPDVVHSFVLQISCLPILNVMKKQPNIKWIYSSWGSDLYNRNGKPNYESNLKKVLSSVHFLITDCKRDHKIALEYGFKGKYLGVLPGGGGYDFLQSDKFIVTPASERHTILVKGYQGKIGRCIQVLKAIQPLKKELKNFKIIVFGADKEVIDYASKTKMEDNLNISIYSRKKFLPHIEIMKLMGESIIYIGNSNSDGMPNTLIESVVMGAFPIQSNPGGSSEEIITHGENGLLIEDCEDSDSIQNLVLKALSNSKLIHKAFIINQMEIKPHYEIEKIKADVLLAYNKVDTLNENL